MVQERLHTMHRCVRAHRMPMIPYASRQSPAVPHHSGRLAKVYIRVAGQGVWQALRTGIGGHDPAQVAEQHDAEAEEHRSRQEPSPAAGGRHSTEHTFSALYAAHACPSCMMSVFKYVHVKAGVTGSVMEDRCGMGGLLKTAERCCFNLPVALPETTNLHRKHTKFSFHTKCPVKQQSCTAGLAALAQGQCTA